MPADDEVPDIYLESNRASLVAAAKRGELTSALLPLVRADRKHLADTLGSLHEAGSANVLDAFSAAALAEVEQYDFFLLMVLFAEMLPKINADNATVMTLTAGLVDRGGDDLAANEPYKAFRVWCANDDSRCESVLATIEAAPQERGRFTRFALEAGATHDAVRYLTAALRLVEHSEPAVQLGALSALTTMNLITQPSRDDDVLASLQRLIENSADPTVAVNALGAMIERCLAAGEQGVPRLLRIIEARPETPPPLEQQVYARALVTHGASLPSALVDVLFCRLCRLDRQYGRIIEYLDAALSQHHDAFGNEKVADQLTTMLHVSAGAIGLDDFRSLQHQLRSNGTNGLRRRLLFDALHKGSFRAGHDIGSFFTEINQERTEASLDVGSLGITDKEIVALCRRSTVVLALAPQATLDLFLDALNVVGKGAAAAIGELLFEPVGLSYPETVIRELNERGRLRTTSGQ